MNLTNHQQDAANHALRVLSGQTSHDQIALAGYAGVGKTVVTGYIAQEMHKAGYSIAAVTHAHRALNVLRKALDGRADCYTMFSALGWRVDPVRGTPLDTGRHKLAGYDVLIVDEASMIDSRMYAAVQRIREQRTLRVLWVGDPAQLPPVSDSGEMSPVFTDVTEQARLTEVVRQAKDSPIIRASMYVRGCLEHNMRPDIYRMQEYTVGDALTIAPGGSAAVSDMLISAIEHGMDVASVAWTNKAVGRVTDIVSRHFHPPGSERLVEGDRVLFGRGMHRVATTDERAMVTTVLGKDTHGPLDAPCLQVVLVTDTAEEHTLWTPCDLSTVNSQMRRLSKARGASARNARNAKSTPDRMYHETKRDDYGTALAECEAAYADLRPWYAMTAHKAQGSTFDACVVDWSDMIKNSDTATLCRLLYVAVTRPSKYLVIVV